MEHNRIKRFNENSELNSEVIKEEFNPMDGIDNFLNDPTMIALATAWLLMGKYKVDNLKSWKNDFLDYCNLMGYTIDKEVLDYKFNQLIDKVKKIIKFSEYKNAYTYHDNWKRLG